VRVRFLCPSCEQPSRLTLPGPADWQCPACDQRLALAELPAGGSLPACAICGNRELYKRKDFPHGLGLTILTIACLISFISYGLYEKWLTWGILIGTALFDCLLYLWVGDVVICYRCQAQHRGLGATEEYKPFDLGTAERYRQERLRREQVQASRRAGPGA
jgi:hypothetical protein